jgi:hypothetical protein
MDLVAVMVALLPSGSGQGGYKDRYKRAMVPDNNTRPLDWCGDAAGTTTAAGEGGQPAWVPAALGSCHAPSTLTSSADRSRR